MNIKIYRLRRVTRATLNGANGTFRNEKPIHAENRDAEIYNNSQLLTRRELRCRIFRGAVNYRYTLDSAFRHYGHSDRNRDERFTAI